MNKVVSVSILIRATGKVCVQDGASTLLRILFACIGSLKGRGKRNRQSAVETAPYFLSTIYPWGRWRKDGGGRWRKERGDFKKPYNSLMTRSQIFFLLPLLDCKISCDPFAPEKMHKEIIFQMYCLFSGYLHIKTNIKYSKRYNF